LSKKQNNPSQGGWLHTLAKSPARDAIGFSSLSMIQRSNEEGNVTEYCHWLSGRRRGGVDLRDAR
jgi:hypothetical protein